MAELLTCAPISLIARGPMTSQPIITAETPADAAAVEGLIAAAFGPGRFAKTAERLREGNHPLLDLSAVARQDGEIVGCSRLWPIHIGERPAILLGPFAVDASRRSSGLGAAMIEWCCEQANAAGQDLVLLVGDTASVSFPRLTCTCPGL